MNKLPLLLINGTNQEISLRRGSVVGRADPVVENMVSGLTERIASVEQVKTEDLLSEFDSPSEYKPLVADLLNKIEIYLRQRTVT